MILYAPTGLYRSELPVKPTDDTSIIYTISAGLPPRVILSFSKIPNGIRNQQHTQRLYSTQMRRQYLGDLIYTSKTNNPITISDADNLVSVGQVFDFTANDQPVASLDPVGDSITTKHNNDYIDEARLGLSDIDSTNLASSATNAQRQILDMIDIIQNRKQTLEVEIQNYQKTINEASKVIAGLNIILNISPSDSCKNMLDRIMQTQQMASDSMNAAITELNTIPDQISALRDNLVSLANLVK